MPHLLCVPYLPRPLRLLWRLTMPGYGNPNRPEWTGKRKAKNFARINAACKGLKTSGGKPPTECPKCGTSHKFAACPVCGCPRTSRQKTKPPLLD